MSRMLEALKQIEAKRASSQPQADQVPVQVPVEHNESASSPDRYTATGTDPFLSTIADHRSAAVPGRCPQKTGESLESDVSEVVENASESDLTGLHPLVLEELDALRSSILSAEEPNSSSVNVQIEISEDSRIDKTLAEAESAVALALSDDGSDVFCDMAQYILARVTPNLPAALLFTSPSDGVGNTETLFSLSKTLAKQFYGEVLLVDANFQHPVITDMFRRKYSFGLEEVLCGSTDWNSAIHETDVPRLSILPNKGGIRYSQMPYKSEEWGHLFEQLKMRYQLILIDAPSLAHTQTGSMISQCDGAYLSIRLGHTTPYELSEAVRVIGQAGGRLFGSIAVGSKR